MKKILISMILTLILVGLMGCNYLMPIQEELSTEEGVTYIDINELVEAEESAEEEVEEVTEEVVEEVLEEETTEEEVVEEVVIEETIEEENEEIVVEESTVKEIPTKKVKTGDLVNFPNLKVEDPEGDEITYTYTDPLNSDGEWQTKDGDEGEYLVKITASDGENEITQEVMIIVEADNKPPVLEKISAITVKEGETITFEPKALDPEGEEITITYSGFMSEATKELDFDSAGTETVRITVSDGVHETYQDVEITIENVNRPPTFVSII